MPTLESPVVDVEESVVSETEVLVPRTDPLSGGVEVLLESETDVVVESLEI